MTCQRGIVCQSVFRATVHNSDGWQNLAKNWVHFFWLTGETPDTLSMIVSRLRRQFHRIENPQRREALSTRNQVF